MLGGYFRKTSDGVWDVNYRLDDARSEWLSRHDLLKDFPSGIIFSRIDMVVNTVPLDQVVPQLKSVVADSHCNEIIDLLTHEQYFWPFYKNYLPDHPRRRKWPDIRDRRWPAVCAIWRELLPARYGVGTATLEAIRRGYNAAGFRHHAGRPRCEPTDGSADCHWQVQGMGPRIPRVGRRTRLDVDRGPASWPASQARLGSVYH